MSEWKEYVFTDVATLTNGRAYLQPELLSSGKYKIVRVGNLSGGDKWFYSDMELPDNKYCYEGDLLYAWACTFGPYIWKGDKTIYHYHIWKVDVNPIYCDKSFLFYYLKYYTPKWMGLTNGSVMMHITKGSLEKQKIVLPSLPEQRRIASILSTLDSKIECNRKICANLEAQAQALFKHWFIDFAPFKEGKFVESELGMIPEGWRVGRLGEIAEITMGQSPSSSSYNEESEGVIFYQGRTEFGFRFPGVRLYTTEPKRFAKPLSTLLSVRAPVGDVNVATERCCIGRGLASIESRFSHNSFIYYLLLSLKRRFDVYNGEGTVFGSINKDTLTGMKIVIPPMSRLQDFEEIAREMDNKIFEAFQEINRLSTLRDTLLPKLMSGQIKL